jgi:hypothetical protein
MQERIRELTARERHAIGSRRLEQFPIDTYVRWFRSPETEGNYALFPGVLQSWFASITEAAGDEVLSAYHRLAMLQLMLETLEAVTTGRVLLAAGVREALGEWFDGLLGRLEVGPDLRFDVHSDLFKKDISICALRMLPTRGPCHFEVGWLSRKFLVYGGARQFLRALRCLLFDLRLERHKLYQLHVENRLVFRKFLPEGWQHAFQDIAAQMELYPDVKALHAAAWFWDPRVKEMSPKMAYLHDLPERGGARFFKLDSDEAAHKNALTNAKRRRLHESGEYEPTNYLMIWPRRNLLSAALPTTRDRGSANAD